MHNLFTYLPIVWKDIDQNIEFFQTLSSNFWIDDRYYKEHGKDFEINISNFNVTDKISKDNIICTRWGQDVYGNQDYENSFYCLSGTVLYDFFPWWKKFDEFCKSRLDLQPWLNFPCILISKKSFIRHTDIGRPTVFNYPLFGEDVSDTFIWDTDNIPHQYCYSKQYSLLMNVTYDHGGLAPQTESQNKTRGICNGGFKQSYDECLGKFTKEIIEEINSL